MKMLTWLKSQSDLTHTCLTVLAMSTTLPLLSSLSPTFLATLNLTSLALQLGSQAWVVLVAGPAMRIHLTKITFGDIQSRLFPKLGLVCLGTGILSLASYSVNHQQNWATCLLVASLVCNMTNAFFFFPKVTELVFELRKHEEGSKERKRVSMRFGIIHGVSGLLHLGSMGLNVAFIWTIAARVASYW